MKAFKVFGVVLVSGCFLLLASVTSMGGCGSSSPGAGDAGMAGSGMDAGVGMDAGAEMDAGAGIDAGPMGLCGMAGAVAGEAVNQPKGSFCQANVDCTSNSCDTSICTCN